MVSTGKARKKAFKAEPAPGQLAPINTLAERLQQDAERLTTSLESAGSVVPLRMLNMAGRQRMHPQRFAKAALLGVLATGEQHQHQADRRRQPAMGLSTLTALVLRGQSCTVAHVGDSRCHLLREGQTLLLTHSHVVTTPTCTTNCCAL